MQTHFSKPKGETIMNLTLFDCKTSEKPFTFGENENKPLQAKKHRSLIEKRHEKERR
jgi:hypothetical protein